MPESGKSTATSASSSTSDNELHLARARSLDYSLRFPVATGRQQDPLVLLFGWAGCEDRYLAKYTDIYFDEGCISLRYTMPAKSAMLGRREEVDRAGEELYRLLNDLGFIGHPLLFHLFSGNGCTVFNSLCRALRNKEDADRIKASMRGLIFDSAPARTTAWQKMRNQARAFTEAFAGGKPSVVKLAVFWLAYMAIHVQQISRWLQQKLLRIPQPLHYYEELLANPLVLSTPQLYLFSQADEICSADSIEAFLVAQRSRGATVEVGLMGDSGHCEHYRRYPILYTQYVAHFLHRALAIHRPAL